MGGLHPVDPCADSAPDITLEFETRPSWADDGADTDVLYSAPGGPDEPPLVRVEWLGRRSGLRFRYADGITFYLSSDLSHVWATWPKPYTVDDAMVYLLGPVFAYALRARGVLSLHASAVVIDGRAAAFCGVGGSGKSTLAAAFAAAGHGVLSDDVLALRELAGVTTAFPAYAYLRVWDDSARALVGEGHKLPLLTPNWDKHAYPLEAFGFRVVREPVPLGWVFLLGDRSDSNGAPMVETVRAPDAFVSLVANTAANYLLSPAQRGDEFAALATLLGRVPVLRLIPHSDPRRLADLVAAVERHVRA